MAVPPSLLSRHIGKLNFWKFKKTKKILITQPDLITARNMARQRNKICNRLKILKWLSLLCWLLPFLQTVIQLNVNDLYLATTHQRRIKARIQDLCQMEKRLSNSNRRKKRTTAINDTHTKWKLYVNVQKKISI